MTTGWVICNGRRYLDSAVRFVELGPKGGIRWRRNEVDATPMDLTDANRLVRSRPQLSGSVVLEADLLDGRVVNLKPRFRPRPE